MPDDICRQQLGKIEIYHTFIWSDALLTHLIQKDYADQIQYVLFAVKTNYSHMLMSILGRQIWNSKSHNKDQMNLHLRGSQLKEIVISNTLTSSWASKFSLDFQDVLQARSCWICLPLLEMNNAARSLDEYGLIFVLIE